MNSHEISWLDLIKEHKWKIVVAIICLFAGISYFTIANQPVSDGNAEATGPTVASYATPSALPTNTATATATSAPTPNDSATSPPPVLSGGNKPQAPVPTDWRPLANSFAKAWANPKVGQEAWLRALKPTVTSDLYDKFTSTDVERMSQLEVSEINAEQEDYTGVNARVFFKNTDFTIMIHLTPQADLTWLVSVVTSS